MCMAVCRVGWAKTCLIMVSWYGLSSMLPVHAYERHSITRKLIGMQNPVAGQEVTEQSGLPVARPQLDMLLHAAYIKRR